MKTKFYALLASAALIAQAHAGGYHGGGGGGHVAAAGPGPSRSGAASSFHSAPRQSFGGGRTAYSGQRFSALGLRSSSTAAFRPHHVNSYSGTSIGTRQFTPGNINHGDEFARLPNGGNHVITNPLNGKAGAIQGANGRNRFGQVENNPRFTQRGAGQVQNGTNLPSNWRSHVVAQHSANWQRNWDRSRDHTWRGHHCRFVNGSWIIFDLGFYPWWPYWYPYDYYAYDYYPHNYDPGYYDSGVYQGEEYYDQGNYNSSDQYGADSTVTAAQERLARQGYYRGEIDGILGSQTRRAVARYQSNHGLRVTGALTSDTLGALGLLRS